MNGHENSVIVTPTYRRPEFLALCLEKLAEAGAERIDTHIYLDWGIPDRINDVEYVRDKYLPTAHIFQASPHVSVLSGTWNILNALKGGYETGKSFVFFVEEDVFVKPDFFNWHWRAHEDPYFVTCGRQYRRMGLDFYSNPGTCYRRNGLAHIIPHICDEYFRNPENYVNTKFPQYRGQDGFLDDGLIRKVGRSINGRVLCAVPPVAVHQGFHYYGKLEPWVNHGKTIQERIDCLRDMLLNVDPNGRYTNDFEI